MKITYEDKVSTRQSGLPRKNSVTADDLNEIKSAVNSLYDNGSGVLIENITAVQLRNKKDAKELTPGVVYHVTDRYTYLQAFSNELLAQSGFYYELIVKPALYVQYSEPNIQGMWNPSLSPNTNDFCVWGCSVWKNLNGNTGSPVDDLTLDSEWELIPKTNLDFYYYKLFKCDYFIGGSGGGFPFTIYDERGNVVNGYIGYSDWGNENIAFNNVALGIYNNSSSFIGFNTTKTGAIFNNYLTGEISNNDCYDVISLNNCGSLRNNKCFSINSNENQGDIEFNICEGSILSNSNIGVISSNRSINISNNANFGDIRLNLNNGVISNNTVKIGEISRNRNNGDIYNNSSSLAGPFGITNNVNNGNISSLTITADVTDTVVNK